MKRVQTSWYERHKAQVLDKAKARYASDANFRRKAKQTALTRYHTDDTCRDATIERARARQRGERADISTRTRDEWRCYMVVRSPDGLLDLGAMLTSTQARAGGFCDGTRLRHNCGRLYVYKDGEMEYER